MLLCRESLDEFVPLLMLYTRLEGFLPVAVMGQKKVEACLGAQMPMEVPALLGLCLCLVAGVCSPLSTVQLGLSLHEDPVGAIQGRNLAWSTSTTATSALNLALLRFLSLPLT